MSIVSLSSVNWLNFGIIIDKYDSSLGVSWLKKTKSNTNYHSLNHATVASPDRHRLTESGGRAIRMESLSPKKPAMGTRILQYE